MLANCAGLSVKAPLGCTNPARLTAVEGAFASKVAANAVKPPGACNVPLTAGSCVIPSVAEVPVSSAKAAVRRGGVGVGTGVGVGVGVGRGRRASE